MPRLSRFTSGGPSRPSAVAAGNPGTPRRLMKRCALTLLMMTLAATTGSQARDGWINRSNRSGRYRRSWFQIAIPPRSFPPLLTARRLSTPTPSETRWGSSISPMPPLPCKSRPLRSRASQPASLLRRMVSTPSWRSAKRCSRRMTSSLSRLLRRAGGVVDDRSRESVGGTGDLRAAERAPAARCRTCRTRSRSQRSAAACMPSSRSKMSRSSSGRTAPTSVILRQSLPGCRRVRDDRSFELDGDAFEGCDRSDPGFVQIVRVRTSGAPGFEAVSAVAVPDEPGCCLPTTRNPNMCPFTTRSRPSRCRRTTPWRSSGCRGRLLPRSRSFRPVRLTTRRADLIEDAAIDFSQTYPTDVASAPFAGMRFPDGVAWSRSGHQLFTADEGEFDFTGGRGGAAGVRRALCAGMTAAGSKKRP